MDLMTFNPWWRNGKISSALVGRKRTVFPELLPYLENRQILLLTGLRRVGKTTLLFQLIEELLRRGTEPYRIFYYSFDEARPGFDELLKTYQAEVLKSDLTEKTTYFFFDEIQKLPDWSAHIKILYDLHPQVQIFLSGSARIPAWRSARESLAGRFFDVVIRPIDFEEFLSFKGVAIDPAREDIFETDIKRYFGDYLKTGGFIEAFNFEDMILRKYIRESILERVIFVDMPMTFGFASPELLLKLMTIIAARPGIYLDYKNLANDLNIDQRTISNYVGYLEYGLFLNKLYNYSPNLLTSEKKMKRAYLSNSAFTLALEPSVEFPLLMEQFFVNLIEPRFFLRTPRNAEIDIIDTGKDVPLPVEIKIRKDVTVADIKSVFSFLNKQGLTRGIAVTLNTRGILKKDDMVVEAVPYWKYWTIKEMIGV